MATATIPVVLLGDAFDIQTLDQCEEMFSYVEENVQVWKEEHFFTACKNNLLRICNDLLRRLSRSQNTVFCGRILLFLAKFFPFSERSGLNIVSEFNLENITEFGADGNDMGDQLIEGGDDELKLKIDYNLYCKFWALQDFFRNPNECYDRVGWKKFESHASNVLAAFGSCKLEDTQSLKRKFDEAMEVDEKEEGEADDDHHFFAKFLTNSKLLALQLSDSNFRRSVLVQFLILFQYLTTTVKFKADTYSLNTAQTDWVKETEQQIYKLLAETPPNGKKFAETVRHMLSREEIWNAWKNDGCKEFKPPESSTDISKTPTQSRKERKLLGDLVRDYNRAGKFYLGNAELTRLWNLCPDNLQACRGTERNFLPTLEEYLESTEIQDTSNEWRALRLLARQSSHFFTVINSPSTKVSDYLDIVRKRIKRDKEETNKEEVRSAEEVQNGDSEHVEQENEAELATEMEGELMKTDVNEIGTEDQHEHKEIPVTPEMLKQIADKIRDDWKKLAQKFGLKDDEIQFFEDENPTVPEQCKHMLSIWFEDDEDASLEQLAYLLEGLELKEAADVVKQFIGSEETIEVSD